MTKKYLNENALFGISGPYVIKNINIEVEHLNADNFQNGCYKCYAHLIYIMKHEEQKQKFLTRDFNFKLFKEDKQVDYNDEYYELRDTCDLCDTIDL